MAYIMRSSGSPRICAAILLCSTALNLSLSALL
jgi:hypothetical protein